MSFPSQTEAASVSDGVVSFKPSMPAGIPTVAANQCNAATILPGMLCKDIHSAPRLPATISRLICTARHRANIVGTSHCAPFEVCPLSNVAPISPGPSIRILCSSLSTMKNHSLLAPELSAQLTTAPTGHAITSVSLLFMYARSPTDQGSCGTWFR